LILARRSGIALADKRGQTHIYPKNVMTISVPLPEIETQELIVTHLDTVQSEVDRIRSVLDEKDLLLDRLERSILERASRGNCSDYSPRSTAVHLRLRRSRSPHPPSSPPDEQDELLTSGPPRR
jgi:hypothetical protein